MIRRPVAAGSFYEGNAEMLSKQIEKCFLDGRGPGKLPEIRKRKGKIKGCIVPHAGYVFSGPIAAHVYTEIAEDGFPDSFIIVGPNHTGYGLGVALMAEGEWETPLGNVKIDENVARKICGGIVDEDEMAHLYEHSIEVQLPFLQFLNPDFSFVPLCMGIQDYNTAIEVGERLAGAPDALLIASTDFSHVGTGYGQFSPAGIPVNEWASVQDKKAIDAIRSMDIRYFMETVENNNISMCGYGCVAAVMAAAKKLGARKARLLKYSTSYDVYPSDSCVGYGAIVIE
ncbi:MAG: MEMO1 family protein [Candidatus Thermoplasmatota archaeon]|nr:MEMO1 family protein [Candidatus Thermoplasmatota archaeon]